MLWGDWGKPSFHSLALVSGKSSWAWQIYTGDVRGSGSDASVNSKIPPLTQGVWYIAMFRIRPQGLVQGMVWERDNPANIVRFSHEVTQEWMNHEYFFQAGANDGKLEISDYQELELNE